MLWSEIWLVILELMSRAMFFLAIQQVMVILVVLTFFLEKEVVRQILVSTMRSLDTRLE